MNSADMNYHLAGCCQVVVEGKQLQRFLNICYFRHISLKNLYMKEYTASFVVKKNCLVELYDISKKCNISIHVIKKSGLPFVLKRYGYRWGYWIGALFCYIFLLYMSGCVWELEFVGNSYHTDSSLVKYLEENGIEYGSRMHDINCEEMELTLRKSFSDIAWCSIQKEGCKLVITITENNASLFIENEE